MTIAEDEAAFYREAKGPLPGCLQLLALEYSLSDKRGPLATTRIQEDTNWFETVRECVEVIGEAAFAKPGLATIFGAQPFWRLRWDILATQDLVQKWRTMTDGTLDILRAIGIGARGPMAERIKLTQARLLPSFSHRDDVEKETYKPHQTLWPYEVPSLNKVTPAFWDDGLAYNTGDFARWATLAQTTDKDFEQLVLLAEACSGDATSIATAHVIRTTRAVTPQSFLVPGLIPRGALTLLLGNKKVGKSAMALELLVAVARREKEWLGFPIDTRAGGFAVYLFGEDSEGEVANRVALMTGGETPWLLRGIPATGSDIDSVLATLTTKVDVLVVDPARKFFRGDEDGSDAVSDFFTKLETFAKAKNCAVIILHHLKRNATPRTLADVAMLYRGSSVFLDRPRVTLATLRTKDETQFGIPASDGGPLHNFLASTMFAGVRRLRRDEISFRHVSLDARPAGEPKVPNTVATTGVLGAARRLINAGVRVTRTGKAGLFERKPAEIAGMPRVAVRAAVDALVGDGLLNIDSDGGVLTLPAAARPDAVVSLA